MRLLVVSIRKHLRKMRIAYTQVARDLSNEKPVLSHFFFFSSHGLQLLRVLPIKFVFHESLANISQFAVAE